MWHWIGQNKNWLFSGAGITVLAAVWWLARRLLARSRGTHVPSASTRSNAQIITAQPMPKVKAVNFKLEFAQGLGKTGQSCFVLSFRNDGWADATNVVANIGYVATSGQRMLADYGGWIEHQPVINIFRGHTRNLIVAATDAGKNFAVTDIGPATNYTNFRLVEVGEITPGEWKMIVTLSADNFRKDYRFDLTPTHDGSMLCTPTKRSHLRKVSGK
jgi:hypothetical protein